MFSALKRSLNFDNARFVRFFQDFDKSKVLRAIAKEIYRENEGHEMIYFDLPEPEPDLEIEKESKIPNEFNPKPFIDDPKEWKQEIMNNQKPDFGDLMIE